MKVHHFQALVIGALCLGAAVLAAETYNQHQQLPKPASDDAMPEDLQTLAARMRESYNANAGSWWSSAGGAPTVDFDPEMTPPGRRHAP